MANWLSLIGNVGAMTWTRLFYLLLAVCISSIALKLAILSFGGKVEWKRAFAVNICSSLIPLLLLWLFPYYLTLLTFLLIIFSYQYFFQLTFWKAIGAWFLQYVFAALIVFLLIWSGWLI
ncbi:hypothetical protein HYS48_04955 [Candidatus Woesearchaeota archaeon]|nr:hypothetical protein [Candidatus Woesearchaeota archaeon]